MDMKWPKGGRGLWIFLGAAALVGGLAFLLMLRGLHYMESTEFCGGTCHVMEPQRSAHSFSPHAKVACGTCHIGPGVVHMAQSKMEAMRETWSFLTRTYPQPITSPVKHLRPARFTCEQCHWPQKYYGDKKITKIHYADDPGNTRQWYQLVMKTGGAETPGRKGHGIHWHIEQEIDYAAADDRRLVIPWVKVKKDGKETVYRLEGFEGADEWAKKKGRVRRMDCMDCHNRATHVLKAPEVWLDREIEEGRLPSDLPHLKQQAALYLNMEFKDRNAARSALEKVPAFYRESLPKVYQKRAAEIDALPESLLAVFDKTQFPAMKTDWKTNPNHIGHTQGGPGCFRCHDGKHSDDTGRTISQDCNLCHSQPVFGTGQPPVEKLKPLALKGATHQTLSCDGCHGQVPDIQSTGIKALRPAREACLACHDEGDHPKEGAMATLSCGECHHLHKDAPKGGSCLSCHQGVQKRGKHAEHLGMDLSCTQCHTKHMWKVDDKVFKKTCLACHEGEKPSFAEKFYPSGKPTP